MSGNAMEEGLMLQIHNPSHTDPSRIGFLAGAIPGFAIVIFLPMFTSVLTGFGVAFLAVWVTLIIGVGVTAWLQAKIKRAEVSRLIAMRAAQDQKSLHEIAEMNAGRRFENWPHHVRGVSK